MHEQTFRSDLECEIDLRGSEIGAICIEGDVFDFGDLPEWLQVIIKRKAKVHLEVRGD